MDPCERPITAVDAPKAVAWQFGFNSDSAGS